MSYTCEFNGHELSSLFTVDLKMVRSLPVWEPNLIDVPGRIGAIFGGTNARPVEITMRLATLADARENRMTSLRTLASWLAVEVPCDLVLGDEGIWYRKAIPTGNIDIEQFIDSEVFEITFVCPDPLLYGSSVSRSVGTSSTTINVGGTAPTRPYITVTATTNSSGVWAITNSTTGDVMQIEGLTTGTSHSLIFDCVNRRVSVDSVVKMLTIASNWFKFNPGNNTLRVTTGSGTATVQYYERAW